jgi:radical SAM superfamily enzyme YgiQ (UPF0313 family)
MRVLLINPFYPISETPSPPLGLAFLAAALERAGIEVRILDFVVFPYRKRTLESTMADFSPDVIGATSVTMSFNDAIAVIRDAKSVDPDVFTVMGGPHVTFCAPETLRGFPQLDCVVLGEGEETIVELAMAEKTPRGLAGVPGIVFRGGSDVVSTGPRKTAIDVDTLPVPARHLLPLGRYRALGLPISMTTSRGCPHNCIFCVGRKMVGAKVRYRNPKKVVDEMESLAALEFRQINLADDLFTANEKHCLAVCDEILERGLQVPWTSFARVDTVSPLILSRMREAGCHTVSFGIESANAGILKTIKKGISTQQAVAAVEMCNEAGIAPNASFILGLPGETPETIKETVEFGEKIKAMGVAHGFHTLAPFPGTEIREASDRFGLRILTNDWPEYHANRAIVETASVSRDMIDGIVAGWEKDFVDYLDDLGDRFRRGEATETEAWPVLNLERCVLTYDLMMGGILEQEGSGAKNGNPASAATGLKELAKRIERSTKYDEKQTLDVLSRALQRGDLRLSQHDGVAVWEWVNRLGSVQK